MRDRADYKRRLAEAFERRDQGVAFCRKRMTLVGRDGQLYEARPTEGPDGRVLVHVCGPVVVGEVRYGARRRGTYRIHPEPRGWIDVTLPLDADLKTLFLAGNELHQRVTDNDPRFSPRRRLFPIGPPLIVAPQEVHADAD